MQDCCRSACSRRKGRHRDVHESFGVERCGDDSSFESQRVMELEECLIHDLQSRTVPH